MLDITDGPKVAALPEMVPKAFRPIDILINNAGHDIGGRKRFDIGSAGGPEKALELADFLIAKERDAAKAAQ